MCVKRQRFNIFRSVEQFAVEIKKSEVVVLSKLAHQDYTMSTVNGCHNSKVDFALFGVGRIGLCHLQSIIRHPRIRLKYVVEQNIDYAQDVLARVGLENVNIVDMSETQAVLADKSVAGIVICTPTPTHPEIIKQALNAGKPVLCEKPIAPTLTAAAECYDLAQRTGVPLFCAFNRRFDPHFASLIKRARCGDIGELRYIKTTFRDTVDPSMMKALSHVGSIFSDLGIHEVDTICQIAGELPETISATGHAFLPVIKENGDFDQAVFTLKFPSGLIAHVELSRFCNYGYDQRIEVFGDKGRLQVDNVHTTNVSFSSDNGITQDSYLPSFPDRYEASFFNEMDHFVKIVEGKEKVSVTKEQSLAAIRLTDICLQAALSGTTIKVDAV